MSMMIVIMMVGIIIISELLRECIEQDTWNINSTTLWWQEYLPPSHK